MSRIVAAVGWFLPVALVVAMLVVMMFAFPDRAHTLGTVNAIPRFVGTSSIGDSALSDNGTVITSTERINGTVGVFVGAVISPDTVLVGSVTAANETHGRYGVEGAQSGTYDTTAGILDVPAVLGVCNAARAAGANAVVCPGIETQCAGGAGIRCYSLRANDNSPLYNPGGISVIAGVDPTGPGYINSTVDFTTTLLVNGAAVLGQTVSFAGFAAQAEYAQAATVPTVNHGTLSADGSNWMGRITAVGAFTAVTLTFGGGFPNTSHCQLTVIGAAAFFFTVTVSATAPTFNCFNVAGVAANCPDLEYECWGN